MSKKIFTLLTFVILLVGVTGDAWGQGSKHARATAPKTAVAKIGEFHKLAVGEKLIYNVKWNNANAARLILEVQGKGEFHDHDGYQITTKVETTGLIRRTILEVNDVFTTFLDAKTRLTFRAERDIKEGPKTETGTIRFDQQKLKAELDDATSVDLKKPTFDTPGLLWAIRNLDFKGEKTQMLYGLDARRKKVFEVEVERLDTDTLTVDEKEIEVIQLAIRPQNKDGKISDELQARIWISNDPQRLPVLITANAPFGEIRGELLHLPRKSSQPSATGVQPKSKS